MFKSSGTLLYSNNPYKLIVSVDNEIGRYYRSLIPPYHKVQKPLYDSHISTIRNEVPTNFLCWGKYQNRVVEFEYESFIYNDELYYWLNVYCQDLEDIREELGLQNTSPFTRSPDGKHRFHITIANLKHIINK
jgi:hypothetical protein